MGYTHYWRRDRDFDPTVFEAAVEDIKTVLAALESDRMPLAGWDGKGRPELTKENISFNGLTACGHPQSENGITWPSDGAGGIEEPYEENGQWFAGALLATRSCGGNCSHETFRVSRAADKDFAFCKTAYKPYDLAVTAALLILKKHLKDAIRINSDGEDEHWEDARRACRIILGDEVYTALHITSNGLEMASESILGKEE